PASVVVVVSVVRTVVSLVVVVMVVVAGELVLVVVVVVVVIGGVYGVPCPSMWIHLATDGTPSELTTNSMYQPRGARFSLIGATRFRPPAMGEAARGTMRGDGLVACVTAAGGISTAWASAGSTFDTLTWKGVLESAELGAEPICGRVPR